ncbi:MAG: HD domain-containing protein [Eggerthellaceae bacterium]|nr:HD domain-containing protein [Eggerthellaceae bacterium]
MTLNVDISVSTQALQALEALEGAGHEAWVVGGCVRDSLLGREVNDFDIATSACWKQVESVMQDAGFTVHRTGVRHGTVTATLDGVPLEITTYRSDGAYSDGRHPDEVTFVGSIEEDLARRDFTVNALAFHPDRGLLDCWGGVSDLEAGVIRTVGDPARRFGEDGLRILRGCRFASQLGFEIDEETLQAMKSRKRMLLGVSAERVTHELDALLLGEHVHDALMETVGVLCAVIPELAACKGFDQKTPYHIYDVWEHIAWVVQRCPADRVVRWAALFHDIGKPAACFLDGDRAHFYGHALLSASLAKGAMERLLMSPAFMNRVLTLVRIHDDQIAATPKSVRRALVRLGGDVGLFRGLIGLKRADALAQSELGRPRVELADELEKTLDGVIASEAAFSVKQLAINGNDVLALGIPAGPKVGELLGAALDAVIDERVENERGALIELLLEHFL